MKNDGVETEKAERKEIPETAVANNGIVITIARRIRLWWKIYRKIGSRETRN